MTEWWRGAVIYQIYPRSFLDTNGDGVGDLRGVMEKLDHVAALGVDGVWLSPFFRSPMKDYGYDVADYCDVDPLFGTLEDFDALVAKAHALGLKIIIDQVYSHTSDAHPWFAESRADRLNPKAHWYVWADAKPDGSPPNNWQALFGGAAWEWDARRRQYYLHNFLTEQPDLNIHESEVQDALLAVARFWLSRGVDGFRLDVVNFYTHDAQLRDNPKAEYRATPARPHQFQRHLFDRSQPETLAFIARLRALLDAYPGRFAVGEIEDEEPLKRQLEYTNGANRLHTAYSFYLLRANAATPALFHDAQAGWTGQVGWPSWSLSNHDVPRAASRLANDDSRRVRQIMAILLAMRGTIFLYQGEELGLPNADVPFEKLRDPEALRFWPKGIGRDGARTPMPWTAQGGFSIAVEPWLPIDRRHLALNADDERAAPDGMFAFTRRLIALRKAHPALRVGEYTPSEASKDVLAFLRTASDERLYCAFNLSDAEQTIQDARFAHAVALKAGLPHAINGDALTLPAWGGALLKLR